MSTQPITTTIPKKKGSRKGKKSWKKNIDITEVENTLEDIRAEERAFGGKIQERPNEQLFTLDTDGDAQVKKRLKHKKLRVDEILEQRSSVPAVASKPSALKEQAKLSGLTKAQLVSLHKRKLEATNTRPKKIHTKRVAYDVWETKDIDPIEAKDEKGFLESVKIVKKKAPETYSMKPAGIPAVKIAHPGASYNPKDEDLKDLINIASQVEMDKRQKNQTLIRVATHAVPEDEEKETPEEEEEEEEEDPMQESASEEATSNAVQNLKKTKAQRNKEARKLAKQREEEKRKKDKQIAKEISRVHEIEKLVETELQERERKQQQKELLAQEQALKPKKKLGKHPIKMPSIEVKLQDELPDSLRRLKPEGNLFKERFASLQERNLVEARVPVSARRRYRLKEYEKRSYKNFK